MIIIVGLGNPGEKYKNTRHNVGFQVVDEFARENNFSEFKLSKKSHSLISKKENIVLVKPQTFMNESGKSVKCLISEIKQRKPDLIVVHDDIDLPLGKIRISKNRGSAGHKGVESIIKEIGFKNFTRFRIGISPAFAKASAGKAKNVEKYVLQKFDKEEEKIIKQVIRQTLIRMCLFVEGYSHTKKA
ncbi:aminoacyl-tRNA hydrolase [Patescibacteria group bacterium]|nr:aminoacyl-tRNA hydrolase [Patescibacteria group bacterium]